MKVFPNVGGGWLIPRQGPNPPKKPNHPENHLFFPNLTKTLEWVGGFTHLQKLSKNKNVFFTPFLEVTFSTTRLHLLPNPTDLRSHIAPAPVSRCTVLGTIKTFTLSKNSLIHFYRNAFRLTTRNWKCIVQIMSIITKYGC